LIKAQDALIDGAIKKADAAKQAADQAAARAIEIERGARTMAQRIQDVQLAHQSHNHPVTVQATAQTDPPAPQTGGGAGLVRDDVD